jgi:flavodoxin
MNRKFFCRLIIVAMLICGMFGCSYTSMSINKDVQIFKSLDPDYPKSIVVYDSWSGNTRFIAEAIAEKLMCPAVHVDQINEYVMDDFDLIVIGSPVHGGMPTGKIEKFLSELPKPRMSAVFVTFGAPLFGPLTANACLDKMEKKLSGTCLGRFKCHGFHKIFRTYPSHPDEKDKSDATQFAARLLARCLNEENINAMRPM